MRENSQLFGNREIISFFEKAVSENKVAHAYIIEGASGSGKTVLAKELCIMISRADRNAASRILSGNCPDVSEYGVPEKKKYIPIDYIREIKASAYIKPTDLDSKFFIVNDAGMMTAPGQNAILKLLEEPPRNVFIFLLCESASSLLPTVRSRASALRMQKFTPDEIGEYLGLSGKFSAEKIADIKSRCDGNIGKALTLLESEKSSSSNGAVNSIIKALSDGNFAALVIACNRLPSDKSEFDGIMGVIDGALRDMILASLGKNDFSYYKNREEAIECKGMLTVKKLITLRDCIAGIRAEIPLNVNIQTIKSIVAKRLMRGTRN